MENSSTKGQCPEHLEKFKFKKGQKAWNYNQQQLICTVCGNTFLVPLAHAHKRTTCSRKCSGITRAKFPINGKKVCNTCKKEFPATKEYFFHDIRTSCGLSRNCKTCHTIRSHSWNKKNKERVRTRQRNYMRKHRIGQAGQDIRRVKNKRPYPVDNDCEICKEQVRLVYHHWDNSDFSKGMWICTKCHVAAHWLEKNNPKSFYDLKQKLSENCHSDSCICSQ